MVSPEVCFAEPENHNRQTAGLEILKVFGGMYPRQPSDQIPTSNTLNSEKQVLRFLSNPTIASTSQIIEATSTVSFGTSSPQHTITSQNPSQQNVHHHQAPRPNQREMARYPPPSPLHYAQLTPPDEKKILILSTIINLVAPSALPKNAALLDCFEAEDWTLAALKSQLTKLKAIGKNHLESVGKCVGTDEGTGAGGVKEKEKAVKKGAGAREKKVKVEKVEGGERKKPVAKKRKRGTSVKEEEEPVEGVNNDEEDGGVKLDLQDCTQATKSMKAEPGEEEDADVDV